MKLLFALLILSTSFARAQTCPFVTCRDSLNYTATVGSLAINPGYNNVSYSLVSGPGVITGASVTGLKSGTTTVVLAIATNAGTSVASVKVITVAGVPVVPRTVTGLKFDGKQWTLIYNSGPNSTL